jgi:hypothetical protein
MSLVNPWVLQCHIIRLYSDGKPLFINSSYKFVLHTGALVSAKSWEMDTPLLHIPLYACRPVAWYQIGSSANQVVWLRLCPRNPFVDSHRLVLTMTKIVYEGSYMASPSCKSWPVPSYPFFSHHHSHQHISVISIGHHESSILALQVPSFSIWKNLHLPKRLPADNLKTTVCSYLMEFNLTLASFSQHLGHYCFCLGLITCWDSLRIGHITGIKSSVTRIVNLEKIPRDQQHIRLDAATDISNSTFSPICGNTSPRHEIKKEKLDAKYLLAWATWQ